MKTSLATLLLVFAHHGAAAHTIRGIEDHTPHRDLKEGRSKKKDKDSNEAYRVIEGKIHHSKDYNTIRFKEDPPVLWLVVKKGDEKAGSCVSDIAEWVLEEFNMDLAVIENDPKDRVKDEDIVAFIEKKPSTAECRDIADEIEDAPGMSDRRRGGMFDSGEQNLAFFDIKTEDKDCDKDCKKDKDKCEDAAGDDEEALDECKKEERDCKKDCEEECEDDCDDKWDGIFNSACKKKC
jgi:hypothetical protein